jgi:diaminopimelate epimerase
MEFWKGHALGNDYIVLDPADGAPPAPAVIRGLCDRHRGVGSDGVLVADRRRDPVGLRIFNPDGSEAEKSGNGLRIFGAWLHRTGRVAAGDALAVALPGETVELRVVDRTDDGALVLSVDMGRASFRAGDLAYAAAPPDAEVLGDAVEAGGEEVRIHLVSVGNPHCVVFTETLDLDRFRRLAPAIQGLPAFERGVNVQLARVVAPDAVEIRIRERGAGETRASGSSACAVAAAARRTGRIDAEEVAVRMPGGTVRVRVDADWAIRLTGEARIVFAGDVDPAALPD